ncbi:MAG: GTPase Era [Deltaproteobacteria bacterium]|nr:GTPase Era [Deltaproteobacteria bacterium]
MPIETQTQAGDFRSGFVAIVGRPNVGKSTLLNRLLGQKVAIVTPKPQTTRGRILGILTRPDAQVIFVDTPGLHKARSRINQHMVRAAEAAIEEADVILFLVDATTGLSAADRAIAADLGARSRQLCVVLNKIDKTARAKLLPILAELNGMLPQHDVVPVSARTGANCDELMRQIVGMLPTGPKLYDDETFTDQTERMLVQELVREKVLLLTRQEIPYAVAVTVDKFEDKGKVAVISATIHVERESQKPILIGQGGRRIKEIGQAARLEIEAMLDRRVFLELFVRVQADWTQRESLLREFGV